MSTYLEAVMHGENEAYQEAKRYDTTNAAVVACLDVLDSVYPEFKKSSGPFGDKLAADLHRRIEQAFNELRKEEESELTTLKKLQGKYRNA